MPIRGQRNPMPKSGGKPTGIFSTRGRQKQDGASGPGMGTLSYAHSNTNDKNGTGKGSGGGNAGLRHQSPKRGY